MSQIFKQGKNWIIIATLKSTDDIKEMLATVDPTNYADYTSAKGSNSKQNYIIPPSWMPNEQHRYPEHWDTVKERLSKVVIGELIHYGILPFKWKEIHPVSAWTVTGGEGSWHTVHDHGPDTVSSIIYTAVPPRPELDAPYTLGSTYFVLDGEPFSDLTKPNMRVFHINPHENMIVIFPSHLLHGVYPQGPGLRQTLNIDFHGDPNHKYGLETAGSASYN